MSIVIVSPTFCKAFKIAGIALCPFIIVRSERHKHNPILINHEKIHIRQQLELLVLPFYILYVGNYLANLWVYRNRYLAYKNISFEKEAYENEWNTSYLEERKWGSFWKYWKG